MSLLFEHPGASPGPALFLRTGFHFKFPVGTPCQLLSSTTFDAFRVVTQPASRIVSTVASSSALLTSAQISYHVFAMTMPQFTTPPPTQNFALISFPSPDILLVTFNRPKSLNCINISSHWELHNLFEWFDREPSLRVAVVTGTGRAFCAGADLKGESHLFTKGSSFMVRLGCKHSLTHAALILFALKFRLGLVEFAHRCSVSSAGSAFTISIAMNPIIRDLPPS